VDSTGGCKEIGEVLGWFLPVESFARSVVEAVGGGLRGGGVVDGEVRALGEVLT
jgi:hypothetical protein